MIIPLIVVPLVSLLTKEMVEGRDEYYAILAGEKESDPEPLET